MVESTVKLSMADDNVLGCSYAIVEKCGIGVILILKHTECAIFDWADLTGPGAFPRYLLYKHYPDAALAYTDFLKLIGKMCKKRPDSKYFRSRIQEDNRMAVDRLGVEHLLSEEERPQYHDRFSAFLQFVARHRTDFSPEVSL